MPYLVRVLGEGQFGLISFSTSFVSLFFPIAEYGFMLTAPRSLALHQNNLSEVGKIISNVILAKVLLGFCSFTIVLFLIFFEKRLSENITLHFFSLLLLWGQVLMPSWAYQGLGVLKKFVGYTLILNITYVLFITIFIRSSKDFLYVNLGQALIAIVVYLVALGNIVFPIQKYLNFSLKGAFEEIRNGFFFFLTNLLHFVFITANIVILGFFVSGKQLDNYSYAEKIYMIFRIVSGIIYQMAYPKVFLLKEHSPKAANDFLIKLFFAILLIFVIVSSVLFWQAEFIIKLFTGKQNVEAAELLKILSFSSLIYALSVPVSQKILVFYSSKIFVLILFLAVLFNIAVNLYTVPLYGAKGTATTLLLTEAFFLILSTIYVLIANNLEKKEWII